jgi:hypothetical protein
MTEVDVQARLTDVLHKRWTRADGSLNLGGSAVFAFDTSRVQFRVEGVEYRDVQKSLVKRPVVARETVFLNDAGSTLHRTFEYDKQITDSYKWQVNAGLKLTAGATVTVGLPLVASGEVTTSAEISLEGGSETTHDEVVEWKDSTTIDVPPNTRLRAVATVATGSFADVPFTARLFVFGQVGAQVSWGSEDRRWLWGDLDTGVGWFGPGFAPLEKLPLDQVDRRFTVEGVCGGALGFYATVSTVPLPPDV